MTIKAQILELASRHQGVTTAELKALGYKADVISRAAFALKSEGKLFSFMNAGGATYHADEELSKLAHAAWVAGAKERLLQRERDNYRKLREDPAWVEKTNARLAEFRAKKRNADRESGALPPMTRKPPKKKPEPHQKPTVAVNVTIKSAGRGPAYLPGEPNVTARTKYTYGASPNMSPTRTATHAD